MIVKTKFDIGEMIYCIGTDSKNKKCDLCEGGGAFIDTKSQVYDCPKCSGAGTIYGGKRVKVLGPYKVTGFVFCKGTFRGGKIEDFNEKYYVDNLDNYEEAPNLMSIEYNSKSPKVFDSKEKAQEYCKRQNRRKS